jgi:anthranilate synthase component 1
MTLAIRSLVIKNHQAFLQTGAGIVADSDPETEYYETLHKAKGLMDVTNYHVTSV